MSGSHDDIRVSRERGAYNASLAVKYDAALAANPEWAIVIRFYSALHLVQAYLATKNNRFHASHHDQRWRAIKASPELTKGGKFPSAYRFLQDGSEQVRYDPGFSPTSENVESAKTSLQVVESFLSTKIDSYLKGAPVPTSGQQ